MWDPNDIPAQRPEHEGVDVTYVADKSGAISEVPAAHPEIMRSRVPSGQPLYGTGEYGSLYGSPQVDILRGVEIHPNVVSRRRYLPTFAELVDRLSIVQLKAIFVAEHKGEYEREIADILHDIDLILREKQAGYREGFCLVSASDIRAIMVIMLTNRYIWENESRARQGGGEQDKLLKLTHSINGVRNTAKNVLSRSMGDRIDHKVDCFAAELVEAFGNWNIFDSTGAA